MVKYSLSPKQAIAAAHIAGGMSQKDAAAQVDVTEKTVCGWMKEPAFKAAVAKRQSEMITEIRDRTRELGLKAVGAIDDILSDPNTSPNNRLKAAQTVLGTFQNKENPMNPYFKIGPTTPEEVVKKEREEKAMEEMLGGLFG